MCDPVTLASVALTAAGTGASAMAQGEVQSARNDAMAAERIRQKALDDQAANLATHSQDQYKDFSGKQDTKASSLADYFTGQQTAPATGTTTASTLMPQSDSNIVTENEAKQRADAKQRTDQIGTALGGLRSFGDLLGGNSRLQARDSSQIGQVGNFKKGSSNVLAYELEDANRAGSGWSTLGQIASGLGKVGLSAGLSGTGANWFGTPAATTGTANIAAARAADRASVPGYSATPSSGGLFSLFGFGG